MNEDFCWGFLAGLIAAGVIGFFGQQIYLLSKKLRAAGKPQRIITETKETPAHVVMNSVEAGCLILVLALAAGLILWFLIQSL